MQKNKIWFSFIIIQNQDMKGVTVAMKLSAKRVDELNALCNKFRIDVITQLHKIQTGHPGGSLSVCEILTALYFEKANTDGANPLDSNRDRIILSKGHAAPMLYRILAEKGYFPLSDFAHLRQFGSHLQGHPSNHDTPGIEIPTGPLGLGLGVGVGKALALKLDNNPAHVYVIMGDGELNEGTVWESAMSAYKYKLDNLTVIVDRNNVQLDGTSDEIMPMGDVGKKFESFGFNVLYCDGHDISAVCDNLDKARDFKGLPTVIVAETIKGKAVSFMEGKSAWHGSPINDELFAKAIEELGGAL